MMRQTLTQDRTIFVHDFDGVHYPCSAFKPNIEDFCGDIKAEVAARHLPISLERARNIGMQSYRRTGDGLSHYVTIAKRLGLDPADFRETLHEDFHRRQRQRTLEEYPHVFQPCAETRVIFNALAGVGIRHGLLTQSCLRTWAAPGLQDLALLEHFDPGALFGFAEMKYETKKASTSPLRSIMEAMRASPEETVFIEDNFDNKRKAKELDPRILTVHISHADGPDDNDLPDYVDMCATNILTFFREVARVHNVSVPALTPPPQPMALTL